LDHNVRGFGANVNRGWVGRVRPPPRQVSCLSVATEHLGRTVDVKPALGERAEQTGTAAETSII